MQKLLKQKVTKNERDWILYDVGNSGYSLMLATILPIISIISPNKNTYLRLST